MRSNTFKSVLVRSGFVAVVALAASAASFAQSVNLKAAPTTTTLPDGQVVPMWGYTCTAVAPVTCVAANPSAGTTWSPIVITVPSDTASFAINLTNSLPASLPTSLVIVGQLGGGLGGVPA